MKATPVLQELGQSIRLGSITRELLESGTLKRYIRRAVGEGADFESDFVALLFQERRPGDGLRHVIRKVKPCPVA